MLWVIIVFLFLKEICDKKDVILTAGKVPAVFKYGFTELVVFTDSEEFLVTSAEQLFDVYLKVTTD